MSQIVNITITSSGPDMGPYTILLVDNLGNVTVAATGVPKSSLLPPGYTLTVADNIVALRLQSINPDCPYTEFYIPPPPPPDPACFYILATDGSDITWIDFEGILQSGIYSTDAPAYCARVGSIAISDPAAIILGGTIGCLDGNCPDVPKCVCQRITNLSGIPTTVSWLTCDGNFEQDFPLDGNDTLEICGSLVTSPGLVNIDNTNINCILSDFGLICPTTTTTSTTTTTTLPPCFCYTVTMAVTEGSCNVRHTACDGEIIITNISSSPKDPLSNASIQFCAQPDSIIIFPLTEGSSANISGGTISCGVDGDCPLPCNCYTVLAKKGNAVVNYITCAGIPASGVASSSIPLTVCASSIINSLFYVPSNHGPCVEGTPCIPTTTTTIPF